MGLKLVAVAVGGMLALMASSDADKASLYLVARQQPDGGFAERGRRPDATLTAWAVLGIEAAGREPARSPVRFLEDAPSPTAADLALRILALDALGVATDARVARLVSLRRADGRIGPLVNSTIWSVLALRAAGRPAGKTTVRYLLRSQRPSGGWSWYPGGAPDSNDTAAAVQALRAAGITRRARAIRRGLAFLRRLQNRDGGFGLVRGRSSDSQSTAWAIQAFLAAGERPGRRAYAYLARMRRRDGSYRYSARYAVTPVWVTAQVLPALAGKPFPLRSARSLDVV